MRFRSSLTYSVPPEHYKVCVRNLTRLTYNANLLVIVRRFPEFGIRDEIVLNP